MSRGRELEENIQRYLDALETADCTQPAELRAQTDRLQDKITKLRHQRESDNDAFAPAKPGLSSHLAFGRLSARNRRFVRFSANDLFGSTVEVKKLLDRHAHNF
jgi:hypothetical protein